MIHRTTSAPEAETPPSALHRFTVEQYHEMIRTGILTENDRVELLAGWIVDKMPQLPSHSGTATIVQRELNRVLPEGWIIRVQFPITLADSEPEPDLAVVRGPEERYLSGHPTPADVAIVIEVADTTLEFDRTRKLAVYAQAKLPAYWIVNLIEMKLESYSQPRGGKRPTYRKRDEYGVEFGVPVMIEGREIARLPVRPFFAR